MTNTLERLKTNPAAFRHALLIDTGDAIRPLGEVMDPWQREDFQAMDNGWKRAIGLPAEDGPSRAWLERMRGASKTSDQAVMAAWALFSAPRAARGIACAGDKDQARLLRDAIKTLCRLNPWLDAALDVQNYRVCHKDKTIGSELEILSADSSTAFGHLVDFILIDEITNWTEAGKKLWIAVISTLSKRKRCLGVCISNAGTGIDVSWQWEAREAFRTGGEDYYFHSLTEPPSWVSEKQLAEQQRLLPPLAFDRLYRNVWTTGSGDALEPDDIAAAVRVDGPIQRPEMGYSYSAGLDLGLARDNTCLCVVGRYIRPGGHGRRGEYQPKDIPTGRYRLAHMQVWKPKPGKRVSVEDVENAIIAAHKRFRFRTLAFDPWQSEYLADRLSKYNAIHTKHIHQVPKNLQAMASALVEAVSERSIDLWNHAELLADLRNLRIEEKGGTWRLKPVRDGSGHGDRAIALSLALMIAQKLRRGSSGSGWSLIRQNDSSTFAQLGLTPPHRSGVPWRGSHGPIW